MTLIFVDGFEDGLQSLGKYANWNPADGGGGILTPGRSGAGSFLRFGGNGVWEVRGVFNTPDEHATVIVGMGYRPLGSQTVPLISLLSDTAATAHVTVTTNANNGLTVKRGNESGTVLGVTSNNILTMGAWQHIEMLVTLSDTVGVVTIKVNGDVVLNLTGADTKNGGTKTVFDGFKFYGGFETYYVDYDDLFVCNGAGALNNSFLGDCSVETLYPSGNGNSSMLVGSDSNSVDNYALVDEAGTPSTADYVSSGINGDKDTYAFGNLVHTTGTIKGLAVRAYAAKMDSGLRSLSNVVRSAGTDTVLTAQSLGLSYVPKTDIVEQDPNGPAAWTIASVNAAEFGVQLGAP